MRKKAGTFLFLLLFLFGFSLTAFAAPAGENGANVTAVRELNLNVPSVRGWVVFTRDTPANDPVFDLYGGLNKTMLDRRFAENDIYYNAIYAEDASREIVVTMVESEDLFDWGDLSDEAFAAYAEEIRAADFKEIAGVNGASFFDYKMVDHPQCRWMKLRGGISNVLEKIGLVEYVTVVNGQHINVSMRAFRGVITAGEEAHFDEFVQSLEFTRIDPAPFSLAAFVQSRHFWTYVIVGAGSVLLVVALIVVLAVVGRRRRRKAAAREEALYRVEERRPLSIEELPPFDGEQPEETAADPAGNEPDGAPESALYEKTPGLSGNGATDAPQKTAVFAGFSSLIEELPPFDGEQPEETAADPAGNEPDGAPESAPYEETPELSGGETDAVWLAPTDEETPQKTASLAGFSSLIEELPPFDAEPLPESAKTDETIG